MNIQHLESAESITECLKSNNIVLLEFYAPWCKPCAGMEPVLNAIAVERTDVKIAKINIDDVMDVSETYQIRSIPTLLLVKNGEISNRKVGVVDKASLTTFLLDAA